MLDLGRRWQHQDQKGTKHVDALRGARGARTCARHCGRPASLAGAAQHVGPRRALLSVSPPLAVAEEAAPREPDAIAAALRSSSAQEREAALL